jgi:hypothetical protein
VLAANNSSKGQQDLRWTTEQPTRLSVPRAAVSKEEEEVLAKVDSHSQLLSSPACLMYFFGPAASLTTHPSPPAADGPG